MLPSSSTPGRARSSATRSAGRSTCGDAGSAAARPSSREAATRMHPSYGPRVAIRGRALPAGTRRAWLRRLDEPPRQPVRQRQGGELHEDTQGRSGLSDGVRDLRGRRRASFPASSIRSTTNAACIPRSAISARSSSRINNPAHGQIRSLILSTEGPTPSLRAMLPALGPRREKSTIAVPSIGREPAGRLNWTRDRNKFYVVLSFPKPCPRAGGGLRVRRRWPRPMLHALAPSFARPRG